MNHCENIKDIGILSIINHCKALIFIDISYNIHITDDILLEIPIKCLYLETLHINGCISMTVLGIINIIKSCKYLNKLGNFIS